MQCREGSIDGPTCGACRGFVQTNLVVLPYAWAQDFRDFCDKNPKPCPLLEVTHRGGAEPVRLARGADLRTDLPRYRVFEHGQCVASPTDVNRYWTDDADLVGFLIGCSFTFERALLEAGLPVRHLDEKRNVPMYRTNIRCKPSGPFSGRLVVSMRPMTPAQSDHATRITSAYPRVHGAPIHVGSPNELGVADLSAPDYGDPVTIRPGEVPVFWACGVTPMEAIAQARPPLAITHEPGHMFITDLPDRSLREEGG